MTASFDMIAIPACLAEDKIGDLLLHGTSCNRFQQHVLYIHAFPKAYT